MTTLQRDYQDTNFLTSLRAIAILLVYLIHAGSGIRQFGPIGNFLCDIGKFGVQVFFVISGFTIFSQFFKEGYGLKKFLLVRIFRISLPYYPLLLFMYLYINNGGFQFNPWAIKYNNGSLDALNLLAHFTYLSQFFLAYQNTVLSIEWTLGIEVFFYFLFGLLIEYGYFRLEKRHFIIWGLVLFVFSALVKISGYVYFDRYYVHWLPFQYSYMFYLGGLAYFLRNNLKVDWPCKRFSREQLSDCMLVVLGLIFVVQALSTLIFSPIYPIVEFVVVIYAFSITVLFNDNGRLSWFLNNRVLNFLGSISFSFYLMHYLVINLLPQADNALFDMMGKFIVSVVVATCWYHVFEQNLYVRAKKMIKSM